MVAASPDDDTDRLFIVDQTGQVRIREKNGTLRKEPFLDLRGKLIRLTPAYDERGLLGMAFHPNFSSQGRVFVYYSIPLRAGAPQGWDHTNRVSEFKVSKNDANTVDLGSERVIWEGDWPYMNHNGGQIRFGPDGYLYIPTGDGGRADDTGTGHTPGIGNGQDLTIYLGKVHRIDVDNTDGQPYGIPKDNPFLGNRSTVSSIYAYGLRNPAYLSFDTQSGLALVANAGQELFESAYFLTKGGNYGWNLREGTHCFDPNHPSEPPASCRTTGYLKEALLGPIVELGHDLGDVIVGGYIYRGSTLPGFSGRYIFGDWAANKPVGNGTLLVATPPPGWNWKVPPSAGDLTP